MKHKGTPLMILGILLMTAAMMLLLHNRQSEVSAGEASAAAAAALIDAIHDTTIISPDSVDAAETSAIAEPLPPADNSVPLITIDNTDYIGILEIPSLDISLPIQAQCSDPALVHAPCRFSGSLSTNDLVIAGHNYSTHFGSINRLSIGDVVYFTDANGDVFCFRVAEIETLSPTAVNEMQSGDWPLSLFTCTYGGQNRITVRCTMEDA